MEGDMKPYEKLPRGVRRSINGWRDTWPGVEPTLRAEYPPLIRKVSQKGEVHYAPAFGRNKPKVYLNSTPVPQDRDDPRYLPL